MVPGREKTDEILLYIIQLEEEYQAKERNQ